MLRAAATLALVVAVVLLLAFPALSAWAWRALEARPPRVRRLGAWLLSRPGIAFSGALLLVALGLVAPREAWQAVDLRTLALLAGMMLLVAALEAANLFAVVAGALARRLDTPARMLAGSMVVVAVLSALVLNDAVVLFFTPVLVRAARAMRVSPFPFLAGEAIAANLGSAATPVGNPQNAAIALAARIPFVPFASALAPLALVALLLGIAWCLVVFRRDLAAAAAPAVASARADAPPERVSSPRMLAVALGCLALALAAFVAGPSFGVRIWASALGAGLLALALAPLAGVSPARLVRGVDPGILVFFVGLFVLMEGVRQAGALPLVEALAHAGGSAGFVAAVAALSNLVSNVPAVLLLLPAVEGTTQALLLAAASTFAGNLTFFGSAATVIVAEGARARGADFRVARFTLVGAPLALATLALAWWWLG